MDRVKDMGDGITVTTIYQRDGAAIVSPTLLTLTASPVAPTYFDACDSVLFHSVYTPFNRTPELMGFETK